MSTKHTYLVVPIDVLSCTVYLILLRMEDRSGVNTLVLEIPSFNVSRTYVCRTDNIAGQDAGVVTLIGQLFNHFWIGWDDVTSYPGLLSQIWSCTFGKNRKGKPGMISHQMVPPWCYIYQIQRHGTFFIIIVYEQDNTHTIHEDKQSYPVRNHPCHGFPSIAARPNGKPGYEDKDDTQLFHVTFQKVHVASGKYLVDQNWSVHAVTKLMFL